MRKEYMVLGALVLALIVFDVVAFSLVTPNSLFEQNSSLDASESEPAIEQAETAPIEQESNDLEVEELSAETEPDSAPEPECDSNNLDLCESESECSDIGRYWYDGECNSEEEIEEPECDSDNLDLCSESECSDIGRYWYDGECNSEEEIETEIVRIASWNLGVFDQNKSNNETLTDRYVEIIEDYDVVFVQGIQDNGAFDDLCDLISDYSCEVSSETGRVGEKERYGVIYDQDLVDYDNMEEFYPDTDDRWEWPPIRVTFYIGDYELFIYSVHVKSSDAVDEISELEDLVEDEADEEDNIIILGDLSASCDEYDRDEEDDFSDWDWVIDDNDDTTSSEDSDCAYDRIIINDNVKDSHIDEGIEEDIEEDESAHYLVWIELEVETNS